MAGERPSTTPAGASTTPMRSNLRTFMRMITGGSTSTNIPRQKHGNKRMLTSGQLSDLFRRLDRDGNGELDLEEFTQIISKMKINATEEFITRIFKKVDIAQSGTLNLQEFVSAYQMIYTRPSMIGDADARNIGLKRKPCEFICAVRYGSDAHGKILFEMYLGTVIDMSDGPHLKINERRNYRVEGFTGELCDLEYETIADCKKSLMDLNEMITKDSILNKATKSSIFWWVDISMSKVTAGRVDKYVAALGLPNDSKFRSAFSQYGTLLRKDEKSHVYAANGNSNLGGVSSLNYFIQALWVSNIPVVHHIPAWLDNTLENYFTPALKASFKRYYYSRFAFFFNASSLKNRHNADKVTAFENAQVICNRLSGEDGFLDLEEQEMIWQKDQSNILLPAPASSHLKSKYQAQPTWLLSSSDLKQHPPKLHCEDLSIHILNQGHEPACVVTIRQIDDETTHPMATKGTPSSILEESKKGVLGRILTGIRGKIVKNLCSDGIVPVAGELIDSPAALASIITTLTQSFSMNTLGSCVMWLNLISNEVSDLAVSKHSGHAKELQQLIRQLLDYAEPTNDFMNSLYSEGVKTLAEEAEAAAEEEEMKESGGGGVNSTFERMDSIDSDEEFEDLKSGSGRLRTRTISYGSRVSMSMNMRSSKDGSSSHRHSSQVQQSVAILPSACQNVPISFLYARPFLGKNPLQHLSILVDGDESLEVKGIKYWTEQLLILSQTVDKVKEDIRISLDEKRNFFNFILTMVTVYLAPLTILCGYWGMNFENMIELKAATYSLAPGVKLMWVIAIVVYSAFLILSVHFRILYSAT